MKQLQGTRVCFIFFAIPNTTDTIPVLGTRIFQKHLPTYVAAVRLQEY